MVSQWPIPPGHFFDYEVAPEISDAGTYFYHSHVGMQALSASGPLIVDDCGEAPFYYDDERIFQFQDYYAKPDNEMATELRTAGGWPGETRGIILNGLGVATGKSAVVGSPGGSRGYWGSLLGPRSRGDYHDASYSYGGPGEYKVTQIEPPTACTLPVIDVEPGKTYRFRFIGSTGLSYLGLGIEDHNDLIIIQTDGGEYNFPVTVDHLRMGAGQRFDVLFTTKTEEELRCNGHKTTYFIQFESLHRPSTYRGYAVIRYNHEVEIPVAPECPVLALPSEEEPWLEYTLEPLYPELNEAPTAEEVTRRIILDCQELVDNKTQRVMWELGHLSWSEYDYQRPVLVDIYERGEEAIPNYDAALSNYG